MPLYPQVSSPQIAPTTPIITSSCAYSGSQGSAASTGRAVVVGRGACAIMSCWQHHSHSYQYIYRMLLLLCTANAIYPWRCIHIVRFGVACCFYWNLLKHGHSATPTRLEFCSLSNLPRLALLPISHAHTHASGTVFVLYACEFD